MKLRDAPSDQKFLDFSDEIQEVNRVPLETPSHNFEYRGTLKVRVIPPGVMSNNITSLKFGIAKTGDSGRQKQSALAAERSSTLSEHQAPGQREFKRITDHRLNAEAAKRYRMRAGLKAKQRMRLGPDE